MRETIISVLVVSIRIVDHLLGWLIAALMALLVAIVGSQFVDRHFIDIPLMAPDQFVRVGLIWLTFFGFAAAVRANENIRIDLIDRLFGPRLKRFVEIFFDLTLLVLLGLLIIKGWLVVEVGHFQMLLGTPLTAAVPAAALVFGCALIVVFIVARLLARFLGASLPDPPDKHGEAAYREDSV